MVSALLINAIGDHYLALPAIRALNRRFSGQLQIIGVKGIVREVFTAPEFTCVRELPAEWSADSGWSFDAGQLEAWLRCSDMVASLCPWDSAGLMEAIARSTATATIGFGRGFRTRVQLNTEIHAFDQMFKVAELASGAVMNIDDHAAPPCLSPRANRLRASVATASKAGEKLLVVHTETKESKSWSDTGWAEFCRRVRRHHPDAVICIVDPSPPSGALATLLEEDDYVGHHGCGSFEMAAALIAEAKWFVGVDSCFLHIADLFRLPAIGLFRSTRPEEFGLRFTQKARHVVLSPTPDCVERVWSSWCDLVDGE